jgi:hypothetical protein
MKSRTAKEAI